MDASSLSGSFALRHGYYVSSSVPFNATAHEVGYLLHSYQQLRSSPPFPGLRFLWPRARRFHGNSQGDNISMTGLHGMKYI